MPLNAGDIAFVGFNADANDDFAFVALTDINAGEVITFTDNEWDGSAFNTGEGSFTWTADTLVAAGSIVRINNLSTTSRTASTGTLSGGTALGNSDESIYAYQGSASSPTFITAISNNAFSNGATGSLTNTGLTIGVNAISLSGNIDVAVYNGARTGQSSFADYRTAINTPANWLTDDGSGDQSANGIGADLPFSSTAFAIATSTPTVNLSVSATTGSEVGQTVITVTATASSAVTGDQTVDVGVSGTDITAGDYTLSANSITILDGQTTGSISFTVVDDALVENDETASLSLSNPSAGITLGSATQSIGIADNDSAPPTVVISEVHPAGSSSTYAADWFEVTNTGTSAVDITGWRLDDSSNAFASSVALRGVTSIPAGASAIFFEGNATGSTDAAIIAAFSTAWFGTATPPSNFLIGSYGGSGIGLSASGDAVNLFDASGNRVTGISFGTAATTTTFDNSTGLGSTTLPLPTVSTQSSVGVNGASVSFNGVETGSPGTVVNAALPTLTIAATDAAADETGSDPGTFRIARTGVLTDELTVNYTVATGLGQASSTDYTPTLGTATIAAGQSFVDILITPVDDTAVEGAETVTLTLNASANYTLSNATATVAIADNDSATQAPTIQEVTATPFVNLATTGSGAVSGVINDPTDPAQSLGIDFAIADTDTPVGNLTVTVSSSNQSVVSDGNLTLSGSGIARNLKITPTGVGVADITVTVSDGSNTASYVINYAASAASVNPSTTRFHTGTSDASTAIAIDADYMLVGDDEDQTIRLYDRNDSGLALNSFDFTSSLGLSGSSEVDIEGSTRVGNTIYWTGSHSNNSSGSNRDNRERIFSTTLSGSGANTTLTFGDYYAFLEEDLIAWDNANGHGLGAGALGLAASAAAGVVPEQANGFNIEGLTIAPDGTTAYISFRAPLEPTSSRTDALIVTVQNFASLIDDGNVGSRAAGSATFGAPIFLDLGGRGIRSIDRNSAGEYLIVAGTATAGNDFKLYTWTGNPANAPVERSTDLTALLADGSFESIVEVPNSLTPGSTIQVLVDNGDSVWYAPSTNTISKDLDPTSFQKFRSEVVTLGAANVPNPLINEFVFDHVGTDTNEYIEILGAANTAYSTFSLLVIEGDSGSAIGNIDRVITLGTTDANGFFVAPSNNALENGTQTLLLVENFTGTLNTDLDTNDDGVLDATPWGTLVDSVAVNELKAGDRTYSSVVLDQFFDDAAFTSTFEPGGASRVPNGSDTNTTGDWVRNDFDLAGIAGIAGTPTPGEALNTPGAVNTVVPVPPGIRIAQSGGNTQVSEAGTTTDTYTIALATTPANAVTVQIGSTVATADQVQLSTDGVNFSTTISLTLSNTTPVTITVRAVDDAIAEGAHTAVLTHSVTSADTAYNGITVTNVTVGIQDNESPITTISQIQGAAHLSPLRDQTVTTQGIVTALFENPPSGYGRGFYLQNPTPDASDATSEAIFVFVGTAGTLPAVGSSVQVTGRVDEFRRANNANNLTVTQLNTTVLGASVNAIASLGSIAPTILGEGGRAIPTQVIDNDTTGNIETGTTTFDPAQDGIDFYESVEGMLVQINNPVATSPTAQFTNNRELWVLANNGTNATSRTAEGGSLITATDFNPERIQLDDVLIRSATPLPDANVGAQISTATGVVDYNFQNFEVLLTSGVTQTAASPLTREVTDLTATSDQLTVATFNVENLDPGDGAAQFNALAQAIVNNLRSPDIISLEEIQDNNGATNDSVVDASVTFQTLINAIAAAGGPTYEYRQINPVDDTNGGQAGGNIRVGFLFNPARVDFVDRAGGNATTATTVSNVGGAPQPSVSPGLIDPTNAAFNASRKPLLGEFLFNGQTVFVVANHFNSKGGDQSLFGPNQPPTLNSETQRNQQATLVRDFVRSILAIDPTANVVVAGDLNDFEFSNPVTILEDNGNLNTLIETLPANERYTYNFQGNAQTLDHILVSDNLLTHLDGFDVVHINSEFADQISDHDPSVARFNLPVPNAAPTAVDLANTVTSLAENTSTATRIKVADITVTDDGLGTNVLSLSGADASVFELDGTELFLRANTTLNVEAKSSYAVTVNVDDSTVGSSPDALVNFSLSLTDVNEAPVATNDNASTTDLQPVIISVLANDGDVDANDPLTIATFTNPTNGSVVKNADNTFTYTPTVGFVGTDSFTYTLRDSGNLISTATVTLSVTQGINQITGTNGNDHLVGTSRPDVIHALAGNDTLNGGLGADTLRGGVGNDTYLVNVGDVVVENLNEGTDLVRSSITWTLDANVENLTLIGSGAVDGIGNDLANVFIGNSANNVFSGLAGNDTYIINSANDTVVEDLNEGTDLVRSSVSVTLSAHVENLLLTDSSAINGTGNDLDNDLTGNNARNQLTGLEGNDTLDGAGGNDTMTGGLGNDTYEVNTSGDRTIENADQGIDLVRSSGSWTLAANVENLTLTGNAIINGTGNTLDNVITGNGNDNTLNGGDGHDTLMGGHGVDSLRGGHGNDTLVGGNGGDTLTGNSGNDLFVYNALSERNDTITDFNTTQDSLNLSGLLDTLGYLGSTPVADGFLRFTQAGANTRVQIDQNGIAGGANFSTFVTLNGVTATNLVVGSNVLI